MKAIQCLMTVMAGNQHLSSSLVLSVTLHFLSAIQI